MLSLPIIVTTDGRSLSALLFCCSSQNLPDCLPLLEPLLDLSWNTSPGTHLSWNILSPLLEPLLEHPTFPPGPNLSWNILLSSVPWLLPNPASASTEGLTSVTETENPGNPWMDGFKLSLAEFEYRYAIAHKALNDWTMISFAPQGPLFRS